VEAIETMDQKQSAAIAQLRKLVWQLVEEWEGESLDNLVFHLEGLAQSVRGGEHQRHWREVRREAKRGLNR